jgi:Ca2+-binding EF-hand superfamily protein
MVKVDLGISNQELQFIISEADQNDNGVVDYNEFVPLAVDMIQSFRARSKAKSMTTAQGCAIEDDVLREIASKELEAIVKLCTSHFEYLDEGKKTGLIKPSDLKRILTQASAYGLNENEINMIYQYLPRDPFGRYQCATFTAILENVRFNTLREATLLAVGSDMQKVLLEACKKEEKRLRATTMNISLTKESASSMLNATTGFLPFRNLSNILAEASQIPLSKLQVTNCIHRINFVRCRFIYFLCTWWRLLNPYHPRCCKII